MEQKPTVFQTGLKYGLILALITIAYSLILNLAGLATNRWLPSLLMVVFFAGISFMAHKAFKEGGDGFMSYGQGLGIGTVMALISGLLSGIFSAVYIKFIDDSVMQQAMQEQIENMEDQGMSEAQIDQAMEMAAMFQTPLMLVLFGLLGTLFIGFIISLVVAAITKKSNPEAVV